MPRFRPLTLLATLLALLLSGCGMLEEDRFPPFRYRMTVEVETPQGLRTGSAVREVDLTPAEWTLPDSGVVSLRVRGEAVAIDLPGGRTLYALLRSPDSVDYASHIALDTLLPVEPGARLGFSSGNRYDPIAPEFAAAFAKMLTSQEVREVPRESADRWTGGPPDGWPLLVTFRDPADPASVERVDPDDPAAQLGEGVRIRRITLAITDDPVTTAIAPRLVTQGLSKGNSLDADFEATSNPTLAQTIGWQDFVRDIER